MTIDKPTEKATKSPRIWVNKCRVVTRAISQVAIQVVSALAVTNQVEQAAPDKVALDKVDDTETRATGEIWGKRPRYFLLLSVSHDDDRRSSSCFFCRGTGGNCG